MSLPPRLENPDPDAVPELLVQHAPWWENFLANLRDSIAPSRLAELELQSAPAAFWDDVFVHRPLPWRRFLESGAYHVLGLGALLLLSRLAALEPRVAEQPKFDHSQVIYYQASEYLPPLDTRRETAKQASVADPEYSRQPIISVPPEADNHSQTIVTAPNVRIRHDVRLPNVVAWSDPAPMPIAPAPVVRAAGISRITAQLESQVVAPPPDARFEDRREIHDLTTNVIAPAPKVDSMAQMEIRAPQPAVIAPPPDVQNSSVRRAGDLDIAHSAVIAPAPRLAVAAQRTFSGPIGPGAGNQVVPPPPSVSGSGGSGGDRRVIALNLHPVVGAPAVASGNRRGSFAAIPEGHAGASGNPGAVAGSGNAPAAGGKGAAKNAGQDLPSGLYVGSASPKPSLVAGSGSDRSIVNSNLLASGVPPVRVTASRRSLQPGDETRLTPSEREVFGDRKFYSLTLNMPNLNSAGGSWVIRFAEIGDPSANASDLSAPYATRKVDPAYPLQLMRENVSGTVILFAIIHANGTVGSVRVLRSVDDRLDRFASEAVAQWIFKPATKDGNPVDVEATFQIPFRPARVGSNF